MKVVALFFVLILAVVGAIKSEPLTSAGATAPSASSAVSTSAELTSPADLAEPAACYNTYVCLQNYREFSTTSACVASGCGQCALYKRCCNGVCYEV